MKKIDTTSWDEYYVGILFPDIKKPKVYHTREVVEDSAGIPYIVRSKFNNGIKYRIKPDGLTRSPKGVITFGAENAAFFYQEEEWCGGRDIYYIDTRNVPAYACKFLASCLNKITEKYTYSFGLFPDLLKKEKIKLPTKNGAPDWQYMEEYMRNIEQRVQSSVIALKDANYSRVSVNTTYWKPFEIGKLFDKLELPFLKKEFKKAYDVSLEKTSEFSLPLVNAKHSNNGIMYYGRESDFTSAEMTIDIVANGAASTGDVYPQPQKTGVLIDAYLIKPKKQDTSVYMLYFLSAVIERSIKKKYSYEDKCVWNKVKNEIILLPSNPAGDEPDWHYMEMYMRGVEAITKEKISLLTKKKQEPVQGGTINNYGTVNIYEK